MTKKICDIIQKNHSLNSLKNEAILDTSKSIVEIRIAVEEMAKCNDHLQINGKPIEDSNLVMDSIQYNAFDFLFNEATVLRGSSNLPYITGIRVHIGMKDYKIVLVFQPTCMIKSTNPSEPNRYYTFDGQYYIYDGRREIFVPATTAEITSIVTYQSTIKIKHHGKIDFDIFDPNQDTKSVIIPFQVIYSLIYDNPQETDLFLFNSIVENNNRINHTILMGTGNDEDGEQLYGYGDLTGKYANRSHLCPPCDYVDSLIILAPGPTTCP